MDTPNRFNAAGHRVELRSGLIKSLMSNYVPKPHRQNLSALPRVPYEYIHLQYHYGKISNERPPSYTSPCAVNELNCPINHGISKRNQRINTLRLQARLPLVALTTRYIFLLFSNLSLSRAEKRREVLSCLFKNTVKTSSVSWVILSTYFLSV